MTLPAAPRAADHSSVASRFTRTPGHPPRAPLPVHRSLAHGACWEWQLTIPLGGAEEPGERDGQTQPGEGAWISRLTNAGAAAIYDGPADLLARCPRGWRAAPAS